MTLKRLRFAVPLTCAVTLLSALAITPPASAKTVTISRGTQNDADVKDPNGKLVLKVKVNGKGVPQKLVSATAVNMDVTCLDPVALVEVPVGEITVTKKGIKLSLTHMGPKTYYSISDDLEFTTPDGWHYELDAAVDSKAKKVLGGSMEGYGTDAQGRSCRTLAYIKNGY